MGNISMVQSFKPALDEEQIAQAERQLGVSLPSDYRDFLLAHNGGHPRPNVFPLFGNKSGDQAMLEWFFGIHSGENYNLMDEASYFRDRVPRNLLPIAADPGGNLICLSVSGPDRGIIYFWAHEEEVEEGEMPGFDNVYFVAGSFSDLINNLTELRR
jgi:cell wall assembly regulator SMI1